MILDETVGGLLRRTASRVPETDARHWTIVDSFPLTPSGKVQKYVLRERFLAS